VIARKIPLQRSGFAIDPTLIAVHWEGPNFTGGSLSISGSDCLGGGLTLTGGVYDNWISSTENGCSVIEHYDISGDGIFEGDVELTVGSGGNLIEMTNRTSGILYKGRKLQPPQAVLTNSRSGPARFGHTASLKLRYTDALGDPVSGESVVFSVISGPNSGTTGFCSSFESGILNTPAFYCATGPDGTVNFVYSADGGGTLAPDTITAFVDLNRDGVRNADEPFDAVQLVIADPIEYVALGDSYSAGEDGTHDLEAGIDPEYLDDNPADQECRRWRSAYSQVFSFPGTGGQSIVEDPDADVTTWACTGAITLNVFSDEVDRETNRPSWPAPLPGQTGWEPRQSVHLTETNTVDMITITIGGNDMNFVPTIEQCFRDDGCETDANLLATIDFNLNQTRDRLTDTLRGLAALLIEVGSSGF
jgi:hypothetical protein